MPSGIVKPGMTLLPLLFLCALVATGAAAQEEGSVSYPPTVVPVVGTVRGVGEVRWRTDIRITNQSDDSIDILLQLPAADGQPFATQTIPARETLFVPDIARELFGLEDVLSPLYVFWLNSRPATVVPIIFGEGPKGAVMPQLPSVSYSGIYSPRQTFTRLAFSDDYRTNVGLVNLDEGAVSVTLALQRVTGRNIATRTISLEPSSLRHIPLQELFPLLKKSGDLVLVAEFTSSRGYAYASVLKNDTHAGTFVSP